MILGSELDFKYFNLHRPSKMAFFLNRTDMKSGHQRPDETLLLDLDCAISDFFQAEGPRVAYWKDYTIRLRLRGGLGWWFGSLGNQRVQ